MKIQILSEGSTALDYLRKRWGFSILINNDVLFDTFCDGDLIKADFQKYNIDVKNIKHIILSHEHWDHTGGLWYILKNNKKTSVYVCNGFSDTFKNQVKEYECQLVEVNKPVLIKESIFTTGEIEGVYKKQSIYEQSLIIKQRDKLAVITGCSHPGILKILNVIGWEHKEKIDLLLGGLHLMNKQKKEISEITAVLNSIYRIKSIAAFHCTGTEAISYFKKHMPHRLQKIKSGDSFCFDTEESTWELINSKELGR